MSEWLETLGRRFARLATRAVVARPALWRIFRGPIRKQFDRLAPVWEGRRTPESLAPLGAALERLEREPRRVLDVGTGTGLAARFLARRFPAAEVVGVDLSARMVAEAARLAGADLTGRIRFQVADAAALPFRDGAFDLVVLLNMIPFFDELARVTADDGVLVFAFSSGAETPIYIPPHTARERLRPLGYERFDEVAAGEGTAFLARRERVDSGATTSAAR